jgi:hypothetical protein
VRWRHGRTGKANGVMVLDCSVGRLAPKGDVDGARDNGFGSSGTSDGDSGSRINGTGGGWQQLVLRLHIGVHQPKYELSSSPN